MNIFKRLFGKSNTESKPIAESKPITINLGEFSITVWEGSSGITITDNRPVALGEDASRILIGKQYAPPFETPESPNGEHEAITSITSSGDLIPHSLTVEGLIEALRHVHDDTRCLQNEKTSQT